jgi:hypothetical protein
MSALTEEDHRELARLLRTIKARAEAKRERERLAAQDGDRDHGDDPA